MIILRTFCDGTTFHHLWDHKILSKRDDWIVHVSEVRFENRSRIENKLYIHIQTGLLQSANIEHRQPRWQRCSLKSITSLVRTLAWYWRGTEMSNVCWIFEWTRFENWLNFQNACAIIVLTVKIHGSHVMFISLFPVSRYGSNTWLLGTKNNEVLTKVLYNGAIRKLNFQVSGRISVVMSIFSVFGLSYGRSAGPTKGYSYIFTQTYIRGLVGWELAKGTTFPYKKIITPRTHVLVQI